MTRIHRTIFDKARNAMVAVSELTRGQGKAVQNGSFCDLDGSVSSAATAMSWTLLRTNALCQHLAIAGLILSIPLAHALVGVVNNSGRLQARTVQNVAGVITLGGRQVEQLGTLDVSAPGAGDAGSVRIDAGALLDAGSTVASSSTGKGGDVSLNAVGGLIQTSQASVNVNGATQGNNVFTSAQGVQIDVLAIARSMPLTHASSARAHLPERGGQLRRTSVLSGRFQPRAIVASC
jgi:hypothetical protein